MVQISLRLPESLLTEIDRMALAQGVPRSDLLRAILEEYTERITTARDDRPYSRVRDLVGSVTGGPTDLGARHRHHLLESFRDRR